MTIFKFCSLENHQKLLIKNICFNELKKIYLEKIQLKKTSKLNQYLYTSKGFKILRWHFKPEIIFLIIYRENNIFVESSEKLIKGLGLFSEIIIIKVKIFIFKNPENSYTAERSITLGLKKNPNFLRFIPNQIVKKMLTQALDLIAKRVDKKLLLKLTQATQN